MSVGKIFLICIAGLALNIVCSAAVNFFNMPVYLDTIGTIFIAALGSYIPGIAVGFFTNLVKAGFQPSEMYYASISVLIAIFTTFFARKGLCDSFGNMLIMVPALTFITGTCNLLIESVVQVADMARFSGNFEIHFVENFLFEFFDKGLSVAAAYALLKMTSPQIKETFRLFGKRQAPLSDEMRHVINKQSYLSSSLRTKMLLIMTASSLFVAISIALISYLLFKDAAIDERIKTVDGMITVALNEIDPYRVDDYIARGRRAPGYHNTEEKLYAIKNSSFDVKYLYVYRVEADGCHVVFDMDTAEYAADKPGQVVPLEKSLEKYRADLLAGRPVPPIITDDQYGYLLTLYKPLYDSEGKCQCYVAIDFSMNLLREYLHTFIVKLIVLFLGCFVFIFAIGLEFVENNIILPVNTLAYCAKNFSYDSPTARANNVKMIQNLKITTGDEIENLYSALLRTTKNLLRYLEHLKRAKSKVADMKVKVYEMDELAHKDAMTGVKNKAAYNEKIAELDEKISAGAAQFCIAMVDVNFLKRVNDNYGHEYGNRYLINVCRLVCAVFGEENVYRIGGDEFVVVIDGEKSTLMKYFAAQFKLEMERKISNESLNPWEQISAAIGTATYQAGDKSADEVFKRADAQMYANKLAMKAARTD